MVMLAPSAFPAPKGIPISVGVQRIIAATMAVGWDAWQGGYGPDGKGAPAPFGCVSLGKSLERLGERREMRELVMLRGFLQLRRAFTHVTNHEGGHGLMLRDALQRSQVCAC